MQWCRRGRGRGRATGKEDKFVDMDIYEEDEDVHDPSNQSTVACKIKLLEHGLGQTPVSPLKEQDKKRPRTSEASGGNVTKPQGSAPSEMEGDRTQ